MSAELLVARFRQFLLGLTVFICVGLIAELALTGHYQQPMQFVPFGLCGLTLIVALAVLLRPSRTTIRVLRGVMVVVALGGLLGSLEHTQSNLEIAREVNATKANAAVLKTALTGAAPALAPGALGVTALIALAATYYHPASRKSAA